MKKYLAEFATEEQYSQFRNSNDFVTPNVSLITSINEFRFNKNEEPSFLINGVPYEGTGNIISLTPGESYTLKGVWNGTIVIDATSFKPEEYTYITLDGVTIISDEAYGILYDCPHSGNKGYKGLVLTLEKDTHNFVVCNKENTTEDDRTYASIDSWKELTVQGVGYLAVYNNIAHGLRGEDLSIAGPHIYADTEHDGIHGQNINLYDGVFYINKAKDGIGTTENGHINVFGGTYEFINIAENENEFDSKQIGYYIDESVFGEYTHNNILPISEAYEDGTVTAYPTKDDYEAGTNGEIINISLLEDGLKSGWYYNADENENVVASSTPAGNRTWVWDDPAETIFDAPQAYVINENYNVIEVTGKINRPIVRPIDAITIVEPTFSKKGKLNGGYDNKLDIYLNNAYIETIGNTPSIANLPDAGRVKITSIKDTINVIINKDTEGDGDHDAIKSENNVTIEVKGGSTLYVTSNIGDGVDGGETRFIDSKGAFIATKCGQRGVKGNAIVIGPDAVINSSVIESYVTDHNDEEYSTFDGVFIAKGNVVNHTVCQGVATTEDPEAKQTGFADVYARNGKHTKGMFGTTDTELKGIAIIGSLGAAIKIDEGNAKHLHVSNLLMDAVNQISNVEEQYKVVPYNSDPIEY